MIDKYTDLLDTNKDMYDYQKQLAEKQKEISSINTIFERHAQDNIYENEDGKYFVGSNRKKVYETYDEVFEFACNKKKERIEKVAEKNLGRIPKCAYDAMLRYDVEALIRRDVIAA